MVRKTGKKILIGHEDETEMPIGKTWLYDRLPADVKPSAVWRDTLWTVDEALGIYVRSAGLFGHEMHSPILCVGSGVPAIVGRWAEQSTKGLMWRDIGLGDWLFDMDDEADVKKLPGAVLEMASDPRSARQKIRKAREFVKKEQKKSMETVRKVIEQ